MKNSIKILSVMVMLFTSCTYNVSIIYTIPEEVEEVEQPPVDSTLYFWFNPDQT